MAGSDPWIRLGRGLPECLERCTDPAFLLRVAWRGGQRRGFILLDARGLAGSPYVASLAVEATFRGQGIGTLLLDWAEAYFRRRMARDLFLCVSSFNQDARRLYERRGYVLVAELRDYVIEGDSELLMQKRLASP